MGRVRVSNEYRIAFDEKTGCYEVLEKSKRTPRYGQWFRIRTIEPKELIDLIMDHTEEN